MPRTERYVRRHVHLRVFLNLPAFLGVGAGASEYWRWSWRTTGRILLLRRTCLEVEVAVVRDRAEAGIDVEETRMRDATADCC